MIFRKKHRRLGLALGSGAARGMAHIGVLKVLEEEEVAIDYLAGTSIGALFAALYAAGVPVAEMEEVASEVDWQKMAGFIDPILPTSGLLDGKRVLRFIAELLPVKTFEELSLPLSVVTTDVETGEMLTISKGNLLEALRAALAFPGIFTPVRFENRFLVDGGLCNPVPVDVVRNMGADVVIGVCAIPEVKKESGEAVFPVASEEGPEPRGRLLDFLNTQKFEKILREIWRNDHPDPPAPKERKPPHILRIFAQCIAIMENEINALRLERDEVDVLLRPDLNGITLLEFHRAAEAIAAGEAETRLQIEKILTLQGRH